MSTTVTGTVGANQDNFIFLMVYDKSFNSNTMKWTVTVTTKLTVFSSSKSYLCTAKGDYSISIGGAKKLSKTDKDLYAHVNPGGSKTITLGTATQTYAASTDARSVALSGVLKSHDGGGSGPGSCKVNAVVKLPAKISVAADFVIHNYGSESSPIIGFDISGLEEVDYARTIKIYKKTVNQSSWSLLVSPFLISHQTRSIYISPALFPNGVDKKVSKDHNTVYKLEIYLPNNKLSITRTDTFEVVPEGMVLSVVERNKTNITLRISNVIVDSEHPRWVRISYKKSYEDSWAIYHVGTAYNQSLPAGADHWDFNITGLISGVSYDFRVRLLKANYSSVANTVDLKYIECITFVDDPHTVMSPEISFGVDGDDNLYLGIKNIPGNLNITGFSRVYGSDYIKIIDDKYVRFTTLNRFLRIGKYSDYSGRYRFKIILNILDGQSHVYIRTVGVDFNVWEPQISSFTVVSEYDYLYYANRWDSNVAGLETDYDD